MPTYEYLCQTCSHRFETWQKMTDEPLTVCPECGNHIRRVLFPAGVVFKGSGFYSTDHGHKNSAVAPTNSETQKSDGAAASTSNGDSKATESKSNTSTASTASATKE